jgi:peptidoglycan-N-acetylglucosamine deacetylase
MWKRKGKTTASFLLTMLLLGMATLTGCSEVPAFSFQSPPATQVARSEGTSDNIQDVPDGGQNKSIEHKVSDDHKASDEYKTSNEQKAPDSIPQIVPSPKPAPPNTPVRPFYELAGSPPTAPGLAMKHRKFKEEPRKIAYLTMDDGPSDNTVRILKTLRDEGVPATFFVIGRQVEQHPELLKQAFEQGNAIGNHTYSHNYAEIYKSPEAYLANIKKNEDLIHSLIGIRPKVIRTPGGTQGNFRVSYYNAVDAEDYLVYDWNVSTGDAAAPLVPADQIVRNIMNQVPGKDRVIILMHDAPGKTTTPEALPQIIHYLKKQGFEFGVLTPEVAPILFPGGFRMQ